MGESPAATGLSKKGNALYTGGERAENALHADYGTSWPRLQPELGCLAGSLNRGWCQVATVLVRAEGRSAGRTVAQS